MKNLVFKGGGVLGIAYAGAIEALEENNKLSGIEKIAGTSAGAITACLLALRYTSTEIKAIVASTDFKAFEDSLNPFRLCTSYGLYKGDKFLSWIKAIVVKKGLKEDATFTDLKNAGFLDLHVFATDLNEKQLKRFSFAETPDTIVVEAIRASMSIPLFFKAWRFTNNKPDNHIYVDGGVIYNFPMTAFDTDGKDNLDTVGLFLDNVNGVSVVNGLDYNHPFSYVGRLFETLMDAQDVNFKSDPEEKNRTIVIDDFGLSSTNFNISEADKKRLFDSGKKATLEYLFKG